MSEAREAAAICPACGAASLSREGADEACPVCGWADAAQARANPRAATGAGGVSLEEARENVRRFGQAYAPSEAGGS